MLLSAHRTDLPAHECVKQQGDVFAVFDSTTQDSGNVSYGVRAGNERLFVKTAGDPTDSRPFRSHAQRVALLRNAIRLADSVSHEALPALRNVVESVDGPILVYHWVEGELVGDVHSRRSDSASAFARFGALPESKAIAAIDVVLRLHVVLARRGWIACDFYDGCLLYEFPTGQLHVVDLDHYRDTPFKNEMGRMFGSTRFMAPEEHELGAQIDERTTVFTLGRTIQQLLPSARTEVAGVASHACEPSPQRRFQTVEKFYEAWSEVALTGH